LKPFQEGVSENSLRRGTEKGCEYSRYNTEEKEKAAGASKEGFSLSPRNSKGRKNKIDEFNSKGKDLQESLFNDP